MLKKGFNRKSTGYVVLVDLLLFFCIYLGHGFFHHNGQNQFQFTQNPFFPQRGVIVL